MEPDAHPVARASTGRRTLALTLTIGLATGAGCRTEITPPSASVGASEVPTGPGRTAVFEDATRRLGISFVHHDSRSGRIDYLPQTLGPGLGSIDYDGDGFTDLFFVQGPGDTDRRPPSELFRCRPEGGYEEVGGPSGAGVRGWGQSCLVADIDSDGYPDTAVTRYREPLILLRNMGDGTFRETAGAVGLVGPTLWQSFATAVDYDRDGRLDLYLGHYVDFGPAHWLERPRMVAYDQGEFLETMMPRPYRPEPKILYRQGDDGRFQDRTRPSGAANPAGRGMAALAADLDGDGWQDIFVANDVSPCALLRNQHDGTFRDVAERAWVYESRGSMGIALGDWDTDGRPDIVISHWLGDVPALYHNRTAPGRPLLFSDRAEVAGLSASPRDLVGWAVAFIDLANDGQPEILVVNGHTNHRPDRPGTLTPQPALLFGRGPANRYEPVMPAGPDDPLGRPRVGRSAVFEDLDHDGAVDVVVGNNNGPAEVWHHRPTAGAWIGLVLSGTASNRDALGARVQVLGPGDRPLGVRHRVSGDSFYASTLGPMHFGLGLAAGPVTARVRWPSGDSQVFGGLVPGRLHRLVETPSTAVVATPAP